MTVTAALLFLTLSISATDTDLDTPSIYMTLLRQVHETYEGYQKGYEAISKSKRYSWRVMPVDSFPYDCVTDSFPRCRDPVLLGLSDSCMCRDFVTPLKVRVVVMTSVTYPGKPPDRVYRMMFFEYKDLWEEWRPLVRVTLSTCPGGYGCQDEY